MAEHPNVVLVQRRVTASTARDRTGIDAILADDCVWRVPGHNVLFGEYRERREILRSLSLVYRVVDGQVHEVDEFQFDMDAFDRAFSEQAVAAARSESA